MTGNEETGVGMAIGMIGGALVGVVTGLMVALIPIGAVIGMLASRAKTGER
jgi:hypothetical protein